MLLASDAGEDRWRGSLAMLLGLAQAVMLS
jgi:hypothetical protein